LWDGLNPARAEFVQVVDADDRRRYAIAHATHLEAGAS
jgi:hypothetical protein